MFTSKKKKAEKADALFEKVSGGQQVSVLILCEASSLEMKNHCLMFLQNIKKDFLGDISKVAKK